MQPIRTVLAQINLTVGAIDSNAQAILQSARLASADGARLAVFPELAISGYPPEDLVLKPHFVADCMERARRLAGELPPDETVIFGCPHAENGRVFNAAYVATGGSIRHVYRKMLLPNYGVFDELRVFTPGTEPLVITIGGWKLGLHICEDSWFADQQPARAMAAAEVAAVINISASPYHRGKLGLREQTLKLAARACSAPLLYCNLVGGQDELVFDGASLWVAPDNRILARAHQFAEDRLVGELPASGGARIAPALDDTAEVYAALTLGLRDYVEKNGFKKAVVALSGGIDSALVAALAVDALGRERVAGVTMPSVFSSAATIGDAELVARNLGIAFHTVPIKRLHAAYLEELAPLWPERAPDTTEENLQARIRGNIIMALSNKFGWLVLTTGNKSELATGYCTLYGDMAGGFAVIKDVPKTLVFELAKWRNRQGPAPVIPTTTIARPPTAELRPDQKDTDSLPPYELLDAILERYVEQDMGVEEIVADGFDAATVRRVARLVDLNEYKRRQGAPGIKITPKAFGRDRRLPITTAYQGR